MSSCVLQPAGGHSAVLELGEANREWFSLAGFWSWIAWRSAYLTRLGAWRCCGNGVLCESGSFGCRVGPQPQPAGTYRALACGDARR